MSPNSRNSLWATVYDGLRREIVLGHRLPGSRLVERDIASAYQVSRVPVREAILRLNGDGLVDVDPKRGATVHEYTPEEIEDLYALRETLEGLGGRLAARRRTPEQLEALFELHRSSAHDFSAGDHMAGMSKTFLLHQAISDAANSHQLRSSLEPLQQRIQWTLRRNHEEAILIEEHQAILSAIEAQDEDAAERLVREHTRHGYVILLAEPRTGPALAASAG